MRRSRGFLALAVSAGMLFAACSSGGGSSAAPSEGASTAPSAEASQGSGESPAAELTAVRLQLQWAPQAQFAGYFAAKEQGYFEAAGLDVTILDGGPDVIPQQVGSAADGPEFTISWVPKVLQAREEDSDLVNIAQIFQRAGTLSVAWADSGITQPADYAGKKVGVWDFGNELEVVASARAAGLEPGDDFEVVIQPFDMTLLLNAADGCESGDTDCVDVAEAMVLATLALAPGQEPSQPSWVRVRETMVELGQLSAADAQVMVFPDVTSVDEDTQAEDVRAGPRGHIINHVLSELATLRVLPATTWAQISDGGYEITTTINPLAQALLEKVAEAENITVSDEEVETEIHTIALASRQPLEKVRAALTKDGGERSIAHRLRNRKALELLIENASITDGEWIEPKESS